MLYKIMRRGLRRSHRAFGGLPSDRICRYRNPEAHFLEQATWRAYVSVGILMQGPLQHAALKCLFRFFKLISGKITCLAYVSHVQGRVRITRTVSQRSPIHLYSKCGRRAYCEEVAD